MSLTVLSLELSLTLEKSLVLPALQIVVTAVAPDNVDGPGGSASTIDNNPCAVQFIEIVFNCYQRKTARPTITFGGKPLCQVFKPPLVQILGSL